MRWLKFFLSLTATLLLLLLLYIPMGPITFRPISFFSPWEGFWANAEEKENIFESKEVLQGLTSPVQVVIDEARVPHIFAQNIEDAIYTQGYITARDRLWQMEFQTHAAAGRLTEIIGRGPNEAVLKLDKEARRKGLNYGAEKSWAEMQKNPEIVKIINAYTAGINAYISQLKPEDLPLEYKVLNYHPEKWEPYKSALLLKYMANMLTSHSLDIPHSEVLKAYGKELYAVMYPERPFPQAPIVPEGTFFDFKNEIFEPKPMSPSNKIIKPKHKAINPPLEAEKPIGVNQHYTPLIETPEEGLGSNNWAVAGSKTASGSPILCNDPHLGLNLPSIWYELQIHTPEANTYGVSLPGAPGIIIGFNDSIAWGVTNAERDVWDLYRITFKDEAKNEYKVGNEWHKVTKRLETYHIKGEDPLVDTVYYTHLGPILYDEGQGPLALKWVAHEPSNEAMTFLKLNKAHNYADYEAAIATFQCPGQNFVFASRKGDIAIWQQGKFPNRYPQQGSFILDAADSTQAWKDYIPQVQNPHVINPERGYVSSTNQHPTDANYPYYASGFYEYFRNRRLNQRLDNMNKITAEDMQQLQLDNYGVAAADILPTLLSELDTTSLKGEWKTAWEVLKKWNYMYEKDATAPSIFEAWFYYIHKSIWEDDFTDKGLLPYERPSIAATIVLLRDSAHFKLYDNVDTKDKQENRRMIVNQAYGYALDSLKRISPQPEAWKWYVARATSIRHLTRVLRPFGRYDIPANGNKNVLNAVGPTWGPSWRMVVSLGKEIEAYGIYPGGQSGNPGSPYYDNFINEWTEGKYRKIWFMESALDNNGKALYSQEFNKQ